MLTGLRNQFKLKGKKLKTCKIKRIEKKRIQLKVCKVRGICVLIAMYFEPYYDRVKQEVLFKV